MAAAWVCAYCNCINSEKDAHCKRCEKYHKTDSDIKILNELREEIGKIKDGSVATKWEYLQVSSDNIEIYGGLKKLGSQGWELVAATSYSEGGGISIGGIGSEKYTIKFFYVFKRPLLPMSNEALAKLRDIVNRTPKHLIEDLRTLEGF